MQVTTESSLFISSKFGPLFLLFGIAFLAVTLYIRKNTIAKYERCTYITNGEITEIITKQTDNTHVYFYPRYTYQYGGRQYYVTSDTVASTRGQYYTGQQIEVMLDPEDPKTSRIVGDEKNSMAVFRVLIPIGIIIILIGIAGSFIR